MNFTDKKLLENLVAKHGKNMVIKKLNEASLNGVKKYRLAFVDFVDEENIPITVEVSVPAEFAHEFENYLRSEQYNTIYHACSTTNNFEI